MKSRKKTTEILNASVASMIGRLSACCRFRRDQGFEEAGQEGKAARGTEGKVGQEVDGARPHLGPYVETGRGRNPTDTSPLIVYLLALRSSVHGHQLRS